MSPSTIRNLTELCMISTYFEFDDFLYKQVDGAPMAVYGIPVQEALQAIETRLHEDETLDERTLMSHP